MSQKSPFITNLPVVSVLLVSLLSQVKGNVLIKHSPKEQSKTPNKWPDSTYTLSHRQKRVSRLSFHPTSTEANIKKTLLSNEWWPWSPSGQGFFQGVSEVPEPEEEPMDGASTGVHLSGTLQFGINPRIKIGKVPLGIFRIFHYASIQ